MAKLYLPDATLVMVETMEHELARLAVEDCQRLVEFGNVLVFTDKPKRFGTLRQRATFHQVPNWPTKKDWCHYFWSEVPQYLNTSHMLSIQWDSWVWDPEFWHSRYLDFDYVGSPWWYTDGRNVGNGGFSLRTTRLARYLATHQTEFPCNTTVDDDLLCRKYRPKLEARGFTWASENLARDFAFECVRPSEDSRHFGFHAAMNFGIVLDRDRLVERARLMKASPYISQSYIWQNFTKAHPDLA